MAAITIKNLLTHTAGIPNYTEFPDFMKTRRLKLPPPN
jgi:CubicO group peptidase (beta-lactamase class C family)